MSVSEILQDLRRQETRYFNTVLSKPVVREYSHPFIGHSGYFHNRRIFWGSFMLFTGTLDESKFNKIISRLIAMNGLLRSVYTPVKNVFCWREYDVPEEISVPLIDLTTSNLEDDEKNELIQNLLPAYYEKQDRFSDFMFRVVLVKERSRFYFGFLLAECIHDQYSEDIIKHTVRSAYYDWQGMRQSPQDYADFLARVKHVRTVSSQDIINKFELKKFATAIETVENYIQRSNTPNYSIFSMKIPSHNESIMENRWVFAGYLLSVIAKTTIPLDEIPIIVVHDCRAFDLKNFHNTIGDFNDSVPMVLSTQRKNYIKEASSKMADLLKYANQHQLYFLKYALQKETMPEDSVISQILYRDDDAISKVKGYVVFRFNAHYDHAKSDELYSPERYAENNEYFKPFMPIYGAGYYIHINIENFMVNVEVRLPIEFKVDRLKEIIEDEVKNWVLPKESFH